MVSDRILGRAISELALRKAFEIQGLLDQEPVVDFRVLNGEFEFMTHSIATQWEQKTALETPRLRETLG